MNRMVYIGHPYGGRPEALASMRRICLDVIADGDIPICPPIMFDGVLSDDRPHERECAMEMGRHLVALCREVRVYGESPGVLEEIRAAREAGVPVVWINQEETET